MTMRVQGIHLAGAALFVSLVAVGAVAGGLVGTIGLVRADEGLRWPCERDRCVERSSTCRDAGLEETQCNLHEFGCGTIPCGLSLDELATFARDDAVEIWMAWGPKVIPRLADLASVEGPGPPQTVHLEALTTLVRMAREWDVQELRPELRRDLSRLAVAYTRRPLEQVAIENRAASLMRGIDLSMALARALDHPYYRDSVRLLEDPDTVRVRLADVRLASDSVVSSITRYAERAR